MGPPETICLILAKSGELMRLANMPGSSPSSPKSPRFYSSISEAVARAWELLGIPVKQYSTALSGLLNAACIAASAVPRSNPIPMIWLIVFSYSGPLTSCPPALGAGFSYLLPPTTALGYSTFFSASGCLGSLVSLAGLANIATMKSPSLTPSASIVSELRVFFPLKTSFCESTEMSLASWMRCFRSLICVWVSLQCRWAEPRW